MGERIKEDVGKSEFAMWRAVFAFSLVDNTLSIEEQSLLKSYVQVASFSPAQLAVLKNDFKNPQSVEDLYRRITDEEDKERFCILARALAWCEGNMEEQEATILRKVACLGQGADSKIFRGTRNHPDVDHYYQQYARSGVVGFAKIPPSIQLQA